MRYRVLRGGSFINDSWIELVALDARFEPEDRYRIIGFRIVVKRRKQ